MTNKITSGLHIRNHRLWLIATQAALLLPAAAALAATDPGVRAGAAGAGGPLAGLSTDPNNPGLLDLFTFAQGVFQEQDDVPAGLGPKFNMDSCSGCHSQPAIGGSAPAVNPQIAVATRAGATNAIPSFLSLNGPIREARFVKNADGTPDGGVHSIFSIKGRTDAPGCNLPQDNFAAAVSGNNVSFRIPTPTFGTGLMELVSEDDIEDNRIANTDGFIQGASNHNGNDGTITRFGWKAQNKSLTIFSGEAYNVEMGVTNPLFQNERSVTPGNQNCIFNAVPESGVNYNDPFPDALGDVPLFSLFMQFLAPPTPSATVPGGATSINRGRTLFSSIGCAQCHTPSFTTGASPVAALNNKPVNLFSDMLVHNMGSVLADRVSQGGAGGDEFRTAPLWGVGQRIFFMHDGRTTNLLTAIALHSAPAAGGFAASGGNNSVTNFNALVDADKQAVVNFLRSL